MRRGIRDVGRPELGELRAEDRDDLLAEDLELQVALERAANRDVDLVRLDEASTLVRWRIAESGRPIVALPHEWTRFQARAASEWADFRPAFEAGAERFRRRLAGAMR